jgi:hypothetical protein
MSLSIEQLEPAGTVQQKKSLTVKMPKAISSSRRPKAAQLIQALTRGRG